MYRVKAQRRPWGGRWRDGIWFSDGEWKTLEQVSEAILSDPCLIVEEVPAAPAVSEVSVPARRRRRRE